MMDAGTVVSLAGVAIALVGMAGAGAMFVFRAEVREKVAAAEKETALVKAQIDAHERECAERNKNVDAHNAVVAADVREIKTDIKSLLGRHGFSGV